MADNINQKIVFQSLLEKTEEIRNKILNGEKISQEDFPTNSTLRSANLITGHTFNFPSFENNYITKESLESSVKKFKEIKNLKQNKK